MSSELFIIKIYFTDKVNRNCGGGQFLVSVSQRPISRVPDVRVQCARIATTKSQGPNSRVPGSRVPWFQVPDPGSQVLILDYAIRDILLKLLKECDFEVKFPDTMERANITLEHKKNDSLDNQNYKPVSILSIRYCPFSLKFTKRLYLIICLCTVSGKLLPPRKTAPRLGSGFGLGLVLELGSEGNFPRWQLS